MSPPGGGVSAWGRSPEGAGLGKHVPHVRSQERPEVKLKRARLELWAALTPGRTELLGRGGTDYREKEWAWPTRAGLIGAGRPVTLKWA